MNYLLKSTSFLYVSLILTITLLNFAYGQNEIKNYIKGSSTIIKSIEPDVTDFSDFDAIGRAIGDARIVMLGEQDHGDAPTFLAKTRLVKYLHEQLGFNVLAFESDFCGLTFGWERANGSNYDSLIKKTIYPNWTYCDAFQQLIQSYVPSKLRSDRKLKLAGIDSQTNIGLIANELDRVLQNEKVSITFLANYSNQILPQIKVGCPSDDNIAREKKCLDYLLLAKQELAERTSEDNFWVKVIENMLVYHRSNFEQMKLQDIKNLRDSQMAMNLEWLSKVKFSKERIIVWAHNHHISKFSGHYPISYFNVAKTMGSIFTSIPGNSSKTYIMAFTSYEGNYGRIFPPQDLKVPRPKSNSLENWIPENMSYAFTDFIAFNAQFPNFHAEFNMSGSILNNRYHQNYKARWNKVFDGVFFIREMWRCQNINK